MGSQRFAIHESWEWIRPSVHVSHKIHQCINGIEVPEVSRALKGLPTRVPYAIFEMGYECLTPRMDDNLALLDEGAHAIDGGLLIILGRRAKGELMNGL